MNLSLILLLSALSCATANSYELACRATLENPNAAEPMPAEQLEHCVCGYMVMEERLGADLVGYVAEWATTDLAFDEITRDYAWPEVMQSMANLAPEIEQACNPDS